MVIHIFKILRYEHRKIFRVGLAIFNMYKSLITEITDMNNIQRIWIDFIPFQRLAQGVFSSLYDFSWFKT